MAVIRYRTNARDRVGVCSSFKADRVRVGETPTYVFVSESHFGPPEEGTKDCVMVGPGVGIAPFRAFVQDRVAGGATGRNWVVFGDQHRAYDFIYEDEWRDYLARGQVHRVDLASTLLAIHAWGNPRTFAWFDPPPEPMRSAAEDLPHGSRRGRGPDHGCPPSAL